MRKRFLLPLMLLLVCSAALGQQTPPQSQPLTFYYDYTVRPGQEEEFNTLVKTVGAPVRDKLMADGVILAWGIETPVLRYPGGTTHLIWFSVANWSGVEKVLNGMEAHLQKLAAEDAKRTESARASKQTPPMTTAERQAAVFDMSKTRDWLARDLVANFGPPPAAGVLPVTRYNFIKVQPGKTAEYRQAWEKYNKPVFDKLIADGALLAYGFSTEEVKTDGDFNYFVWMAAADMSGMDKLAAAFAADRARRTEAEQESIATLFASVTEPDKARSVVTRSRIFRLPAPK